MLGGLVTYIEQSLPEVKQPMGVNWDLSRRLKERKVRGKQKRVDRARIAIEYAARELGRVT